MTSSNQKITKKALLNKGILCKIMWLLNIVLINGAVENTD
jgi:hypothetical protein